MGSDLMLGPSAISLAQMFAQPVSSLLAETRTMTLTDIEAYETVDELRGGLDGMRDLQSRTIEMAERVTAALTSMQKSTDDVESEVKELRSFLAITEASIVRDIEGQKRAQAIADNWAGRSQKRASIDPAEISALYATYAAAMAEVTEVKEGMAAALRVALAERQSVGSVAGAVAAGQAVRSRRRYSIEELLVGSERLPELYENTEGALEGPPVGQEIG